VPCNEQLIIRHEHSLSFELVITSHTITQFNSSCPNDVSKFEGDRTKYRKWKMEILAAAGLASTDEYGLIPFALSAAQIAALPNPAGPEQGPYVFAQIQVHHSPVPPLQYKHGIFLMTTTPHRAWP
jgi:hypothetical protein